MTTLSQVNNNTDATNSVASELILRRESVVLLLSDVIS